MATVVILLGAPGAGKGTQSARVSVARALPHVSTGDLFRANMANGTPIGAKAKEYMEAGKLVPDEIVLDMLDERVAQEDCSSGYVLDGFPRTLPQAEALDGRLREDTDLSVIYIEVPDELIVRRASGRLVCPNGHLHHAEFKPPTKDGVCDECGEELSRRKDDAPEVVRERLAVYHEETAPLVSFYEQQGVLQTVDGSGPPEVVFDQIEALMASPG